MMWGSAGELFFFFQAEDGIRDLTVTGVQTCALPISTDTRVGRIGTLVCWDQWYPEGARLTALQGANVLLYPTAIGWHPKEKATHGAQQLDAWRTIQRSHAIANGCYVAEIGRASCRERV